MCIRVDIRMACDECGYPYCEAAVDTHEDVPHGDLPCPINCSGGCPTCDPGAHERDCIVEYIKSKGASSCACVREVMYRAIPIK